MAKTFKTRESILDSHDTTKSNLGFPSSCRICIFFVCAVKIVFQQLHKKDPSEEAGSGSSESVSFETFFYVLIGHTDEYSTNKMTLATGAYKSNFPPVWELRTDRPAIRPTDQRTDRRGHRKVTLPISFFVTQRTYLHYLQYQNLLHFFSGNPQF